MLGFHSDGIRLFGASDTLKANLKKRKLPLVGSTTGNTPVSYTHLTLPTTERV